MELIMLGHIIGDFYIQTNKMAENKKKSMNCLMQHCLIYFLLMVMIMFVLSHNMIQAFVISGIIISVHFSLEISKNMLVKKYHKYEYIIFVIEQLLHILWLLYMYYVFNSQLSNQTYTNFNNLELSKYILIIIAALVCWKPTAIFISLVFKIIPNTIWLADDLFKVGSYIGILEREIILILGLLGQYGAIGFVLTAKSLARFKQLENKAFAEKYLVGTLLSVLIAILCIVMCTKLIA